jgi:signal transduction histidine kinase
VEMDATISADDFRMLNWCLDDAIAGAVTEFGREQNRSTADEQTALRSERAGSFTDELRNMLNTAVLALEVLETGDVGVGGSTGTVLHRSLLAARALTGRSLAEVRLAHGVRHQEQFLVSHFIEELAPAAAIEGNARGIMLRVLPIDDQVIIEADRQVLAAVVMSLLQNAFTFARPATTVVLRVGGGVDRVLIEIRVLSEIEHERGGVPTADLNELLRPFEQLGAVKTELGLGLAFSRWGVEQDRGRIYARNLPEKGCVFTIDLPRIEDAATASM